MIFNCLRILTRAFVYISYFDAARWRADTEITQKSTSPDSILLSSMITLQVNMGHTPRMFMTIRSYHSNRSVVTLIPEERGHDQTVAQLQTLTLAIHHGFRGLRHARLFILLNGDIPPNGVQRHYP